MNEKVIVSLPEKDNEFQVLQAADARATAARVKLEVEIVHAEMSAVLQIQQLFKYVHAAERPKAIIVEPVAVEGIERVAQKAVSSGIGWAILNSTVGYVDNLRRQYPALAVFAVGSDQMEIGRIQGRQMKTLLPAGGTVLYIQGPLATTAAQERLKGMQEAIAGSPIRTRGAGRAVDGGERRAGRAPMAAPQDRRQRPHRPGRGPGRLDGARRAARGRGRAGSREALGRAFPSSASTACPTSARSWCAAASSRPRS